MLPSQVAGPLPGLLLEEALSAILRVMKLAPRTLVLSALALSACGYTPLYAPTTAEGNQLPVSLGSVTVSNPQVLPGERKTAQEVSRELHQRFPSDDPNLDELTVSLYEDLGTLAVQRSATVARAEVILTATIRLTSKEGAEKFKTEVTSRAAYNVEDTPFSTESGRSYARLSAARNVAEEITRRVALFYRQGGQRDIRQAK